MSDIDFKSLNIPLPDTVNQYPLEKQREIFDYLSQLDEHDKKVYLIAYNHLGSSFNIYKSNGFKEWKGKK